MVAPTLASDHNGLEVLAEVAKVLAVGREGPAEEGLAGVVSVLRRGLALRRCRLWLRSPDGSRFVPIAGPDEGTELPELTAAVPVWVAEGPRSESVPGGTRSEEHTSELQSHHDLVCRLLLEKKKKKK